MKRPRIVTLVLAAVLLLPATAWARNDTWKAAADGWFDVDLNWTDGTAPTAADTVKFGVAGAYEVWWDSATGNRTTQSMTLTGGDVTFRISDSAYTWTITDSGLSADATITGGTLTLGLAGFMGNLILDIDDALKVDGGGMLNVIMGNEARCGTTTVGFTGTGSLVIESGGGVSNTSGYVGRQSGSIGTVTVTGEESTWQSSRNLYLGGDDANDGGDASLDISTGGRVYVGDIDPATFELFPGLSAVVVSDDDGTGGELLVRNGATLSNDYCAYLGLNAGETGAATVTGAGTAWTNDTYMTVGSQGEGTLTVTDGGSVSDWHAHVALQVGSKGTVTVDGGTWTNTDYLSVGTTGEGTLTVTGVGSVSNTDGYVAYDSGSIGTVTVTGEDSTWQSSTNLYLGGTDTSDGGDASLTVSDGGRVYVGDIDPATFSLFGNLSAVVVSDDDTSGGELVVRNGATLSNEDCAHLGYNAGETGAATVTGTGTAWTNGDWLVVGDAGEGALTVESGGSVSNKDGYVASQPGSQGTVTVDGGTWTNDDLRVGNLGGGTLTVTGGGSVSSANGCVARYSGSTGTVTVTGEDSTWQSTETLWLGGTDIADGGDASLELTSGGRLYVGDIDPATVSLGSYWSAVVVSDDDTSGGELLLRNGATLTNDYIAYLGYNADETGAATVTGAGTSWTNGSHLYVGYYGEGELTIKGGGSVSNFYGYVGRHSGSTGTVTVDGGTWTNTGHVCVGRSGEGELTIKGGGSVSNFYGYVGRYGGSIGTVSVTGEDSTWQSSTNLYLGGTETADGGDASLDLTSGAHVCVGDIDPATVTPASSYSALVVSDGDTDGGELLLRNGATITNDGYAFLGYNAGETGAATVTGADTSWTNRWVLYVGYEGEGTLTVTGGASVSSTNGSIGREPGSTGAVTVDGGTWTTGLGHLYVGEEGEGTLTVTGGGSVSSTDGYVGRTSGSTGTVTLDGGTWTISADLDIGGSEYTEPGGTGGVTVFPGGLLEVGDALTLWLDGTLTLAGGTVRFSMADPLDDQGGTLNYVAGTVEFDCDVTVLAGMSSVTDFFGSPPTIPAGKHLDVRGQATLFQPVTLSGGTFSAESIANGTLLDLQSGTFNLTASDLTVGSGGQLGQTLDLGAGMVVNVTQTAAVDPDGMLHLTGGHFSADVLENDGLVRIDAAASALGGGTLTNRNILTGTGRVDATLANDAAGRVEIGAGQHLLFTAAGNTNSGTIQVLGGQAEFTQDLTNAASTGLIAARDAVLCFGGGLTNNGSVAMTFGVTDLFGDINNTTSGLMVVSGGGNAAFYDDLMNDGEVRVSSGSTAVFYGAISGGGDFTGTGTVYLEGDLRPGHSAGEVSFGGELVFGSSAVLEAELGGTAPGAYDAVHVAGTATLGGTLAVDLIDPYRPSHNDAFEIMTFASRGGTTFDEHQGLDLGDRLALTPTYSATDLVLTAVQGGPGEWGVDADGDASVPTNWSAGLPNGVGDLATFGSVITAPREVTVDVPTTLGGIQFDSAQAYALAGSNLLTFETEAGAAAINVADIAATHVIAADVILADALDIDVAALGTLVFEGLLDNSAGQTITKTGAGTLVIDGPQDHAPGTVFEILGGTVDLNTAAGGAGTFDLSILVDDAVLNLGCNQYLDTLTLLDGALARFTGANVVVLKHLVMDGVDLGAMTLTPEPATLGLLVLGSLLVLRRRRR